MFFKGYNISGWRVDPTAKNKNVINGVQRNGGTIVLVIRPAQNGFLIFDD
jgi:hypothetical protein